MFRTSEMVVNRGLSWCGMNGCMSSELLDARVEPDGWLDEIWTARLGGRIGRSTARKGTLARFFYALAP
jgi:hypothetical protein